MKNILLFTAPAFALMLLTACSSKTKDDSPKSNYPLSIESISDSLPSMSDSVKPNMPDGSLWAESESSGSVSESFSPFDDGYEQGKIDGRKDGVNHKHKASYDDTSADYDGKNAKQYAMGYSDGYELGYEEGKNGGDFDREFDKGFFGENVNGFDSDNYDPELDDF